MPNDILFLVLAYLVSIISAVFGFGSALIIIPFSTFFLPIKEAIALLTIFFIAGNLSRVVFFWKHIDWKTTKLIWLGNIPMVYIGASLMLKAPSEILKVILGFIILVFVVNERFKFTKHIKLNDFGIVAAGGLYGFFAGIIGTGSAIKAALLTHMRLTKERFIGTMAATAIVANLIKITVYSQSELLSQNDIPLALGLVLCAILGAYTGKHFVKVLHPEFFKKAILIMLLIVSFKLILF
jgi:uncharacterized membrane protein YfcA